MNQPSNQLKLGAVLSYVSTGLNMAVQLLYTPLMIRLLGQSEYGLYTLVGSVVSYLSLFSLGFTGAYLRFYSQRKAKNDTVGIARLNGMFLSVFLLMSLAAFVCGMVLLQFPRTLFGSKLTASELNTAKVLMAILVVNIALTFPAGLLESMVTAHEKFLFQQLVTLASVVFNPLMCLPLLLMGFGSIAVVCVTTILTVAKLAVSAWYCVKKLDVRFRFDGFDFACLREIAGFSFFLFLNMVINQINCPWTSSFLAGYPARRLWPSMVWAPRSILCSLASPRRFPPFLRPGFIALQRTATRIRQGGFPSSSFGLGGCNI